MSIFLNKVSKNVEQSSTLYKCQIVIAGDFNVHMEAVDDPDKTQLNNILQSFNCPQHVPLISMHKSCRYSTLDLVITKTDQVVDKLNVEPSGAISDQSVIRWSLPVQRQSPLVQQREVRSWAKVDRDEFRATLVSSELCDPDHRPDTAEGFFELYHTVLQSLVDRFALVRKIKLWCQTCIVDG